MGRSNHTTPDMGNSMTIIAGQWTERVPEGTEGAVARRLTKGSNEGSTVWELHWPTLENLSLMTARVVTPEGFSKQQVEMSFKDFKTNEVFLTSLQFDSKYLKTFIMCLPQLNASLPFNLELHKGKGKSPNGDDKYNLRVVQEGKSLKTTHFQEWKKDANGNNVCLHHNGCPAPIHDERDNSYDFKDQNYFLLDYLAVFMDTYEPPTSPCPVADEPVSTEASAPPPPDININDADDDDVPF